VGSVHTESAPTRFDLFLQHQKQVWADIQSSSDEYDKSILTLSSGGLGLSLAFIKDIVPLREAVVVWLLYCSWAAFTLSILLTVFSFRIGILAQERHLENLRGYYLENNEQCYNKKDWTVRTLEFLAWAAGALFGAAVIMTIAFVWTNVHTARLHNTMSEKPQVEKVQTATHLQEARKPMAMTPLPATIGQDARKPMAMTPAPPKPAPASTPQAPPPSASQLKK
jgi:hypothetical protein